MVEFPIDAGAGDEFPIAIENGAIAFVFPEEGARAEGASLEHRDEGLAFERFRRVGTTDLGEGWEEVDDVGDLVGQ